MEDFDAPGLLSRTMDDRELAALVIQEFSGTQEAYVADLIAALDQGDLSKAVSGAHKIKGAAGNLGAIKVFETAKTMEAAGRQGRLEEILELIPKLREEITAALAAMTHWVSGG